MRKGWRQVPDWFVSLVWSFRLPWTSWSNRLNAARSCCQRTLTSPLPISHKDSFCIEEQDTGICFNFSFKQREMSTFWLKEWKVLRRRWPSAGRLAEEEIAAWFHQWYTAPLDTQINTGCHPRIGLCPRFTQITLIAGRVSELGSCLAFPTVTRQCLEVKVERGTC